MNIHRVMGNVVAGEAAGCDFVPTFWGKAVDKLCISARMRPAAAMVSVLPDFEALPIAGR